MKSEIVAKEEHYGYETIVRKISYEPEEIEKLTFSRDYYYWYCGYVVVPKDHPYYEMDYDEIMEKGDIRVHGGLTFSGRLDDVEGYLLGFDCYHVDDNPIRQDEIYTLSQCVDLVKQLIKVKSGFEREQSKKIQEIRPDYYKGGGLEAFDVIDAFELGFNLGNAFKYIARAGKKDSKVEDLRKAVTYLNREIEKAEKSEVKEVKHQIIFKPGELNFKDGFNLTGRIEDLEEEEDEVEDED